MATAPTPGPGALLTTSAPATIPARPDLWGFGGVHGGLALAVATLAMQREAPDTEVISATGRFHRPLRHDATVEVDAPLTGRTVTTVSAAARTERGRAMDAAAVLSRPRRSPWPTTAPPAPEVPPAEDCDAIAVPPELVPFASHTEIRPATAPLPYTGAAVPELVAWIRLVEDDAPPGVARFVFLADALAPSYTAVMTEADPVPTVELAVRPGPGLVDAISPWVLLRARTRSATPSGWVDETIDAWAPDGTHLGSAHQLRVVM